MARKKKPTRTQAKKKLALDLVLRAALDVLRSTNGKLNEKPGQIVCLYDCAIWLLYACTRDEARSLAEEAKELEQGSEEWKLAVDQTPQDELEESIALAEDDQDHAMSFFWDQAALAEELDPGYKIPIRQQVDWI